MKNIIHDYFLAGGQKILEQIANILMPKEEKVVFLEKLGSDGLFDRLPRADNFDLPGQNRQAGFETDKIKAIFNYKTALCRQAIWEIKYRANKKLIRDFSLLLYEFILEELTDLQTFHNFKNIILLPIPATPTRTKEKGFNQCILICQELIRIDQERNGQTFAMAKDFLVKKTDTARQSHVSNRKTRLKNVVGSFTVNDKPVSEILSALNGRPNRSESIPETGRPGGFPDIRPLENLSFIIIDDVITTGATMNEAFRALKEAGIPPRHIRGYALAH
jgi:predicted amidophosphoribosyltransferase